MLRCVALVTCGVLLGPGSALAQAVRQAEGLAYTVGFSTYLSHVDQYGAAFDVVTDNKGFIYISGNTKDRNFPATEGAYQKELKGEADAFVAKFTPEGKIVFATLIGGTKGFENGIDHFLAKVNDSGTALLYLSYLGGGGDMPSGLSLTRSGKLMVCGSANTRSLPLSDTAYSRESKGERDGFIAIFNSEDMKLEYSTLVGGSQRDFISSAFFLDEGHVVVSGETNSPDFPLTENALYAGYPACDKTFNNGFFGKRRFFVSVLDIKQGRLVYSTFFGAGVRFQAFPDSRGNLGFIAEAGVREVPGTDFPVSSDAFRVPPTYIMVGRLALNEKPGPK